eukprot:9099243-Ditylum_brightwellii.AAC.1
MEILERDLYSQFKDDEGADKCSSKCRSGLTAAAGCAPACVRAPATSSPLKQLARAQPGRAAHSAARRGPGVHPAP